LPRALVDKHKSHKKPTQRIYPRKMTDRVLRARKPPTAKNDKSINVANLNPVDQAKALADAMNRMSRLGEPFDDHDGRMVEENYDKEAQKIELLVSETASSAWTPAFGNFLNRCVYIRTNSEPDKEELRTTPVKCVACGKFEHCNPRVIDCFGFLKDDEDGDYDPLTMPAEDAAAEFEGIADYIGSCDDETRLGKLASYDMGSLTLGATCHRRFCLVMQMRNLLLDKYLSIHDEVQWRDEEGSLEAIESKLYGDSTEEAEHYLLQKAKLEVALTTMKPPFPTAPPTKQVFDLVDMTRAEASGGDEEELKALLRVRTHQQLGGKCSQLEKGVEEEEEEQVNEFEEEEQMATRPRRKTSLTVVDVDEHESENSAPPSSRRRRVVIDDDEEEEEEEEKEEKEEKEQERPAEADVGASIPIADVGAEADDNNAAPEAPNKLDSRYSVCVNAIRVVMSLQMQGRTGDSADVANLVSTFQGLMQQREGVAGAIPAEAQARDRRAPHAPGRLASRQTACVNALRVAMSLQAQGHTNESAAIMNLVATTQEFMQAREG
jgi:hypothetical protein